jgi:hypothetical protein
VHVGRSQLDYRLPRWRAERERRERGAGSS